MTEQRIFAVEPWSVTENELDLDALARTESVFALSNGHIGLRGNLDEGDPHGVPGTYLNSVYEARPLPYGERGYGYPESGQSVINVTNGKIFRLLVDDEPFDIRYGTLDSHRRRLDLRAGTLERQVEWHSPARDGVRVTSTRLVSLTQRAVAAICYEVEAIDESLRVVVQSELVANEALPESGQDPRSAARLERPLEAEECSASGTEALMVHRTPHSGLRVAAGMRHTVHGPTNTDLDAFCSPDVCRLTIATRLAPGERLRIVKFLAYGWSSRRTRPALHDQVVAALAAARLTGWDGLLAEQRSYLDDFWAGAEVELEGGAEVQQAARFGLFHILQAGARAEQRPIPGKGLTGPGYDGHTFWDTETFVLPVLTYTKPDAAAAALAWRHLTLPVAQERAHELGLDGAAFPWRTIRGRESSAYWPAGTAGFHINADVADATARYLAATGDTDFEVAHGVELLVETARLWLSLGHFDGVGDFRIDGVTGPDEYTAIVDDNVYTNLMAQRNLREAAAACGRQPEVAATLGVQDAEVKRWREAAEAVVLPYDHVLRVHPQSEDFTQHAEWDFASTGAEHYPMMLNFPYFQLYRKQVIKQADLVLAMHLRGDAFTAEDKARNFAYYEARTVRDSSLSAATQAVVAAEVGQLALAYDYWAEAAFTDLHDLHSNADKGLHIACQAGSWTAAVAGFGGMRDHDGTVTFAPRLPPALDRLRFRMSYADRTLQVSIERAPGGRVSSESIVSRDAGDHRGAGEVRATYRLLRGQVLRTWHHGEQVDLEPGSDVTLPCPPPGQVEPVTQPAGRAPQQRRPGQAIRVVPGDQEPQSG